MPYYGGHAISFVQIYSQVSHLLSSSSFILSATKGIFHNKSDQVHPMCYQANELDTKSIHCKLSTKGKEVTPGGEDAQSP